MQTAFLSGGYDFIGLWATGLIGGRRRPWLEE
jgi:hypothetical protein